MKTPAIIGLCSSLTLISCTPTESKKNLPNIIYILADDLGYGDLSCYGQKRFSTPNIDKLAKDGMLFTQHYSGCTVSAPSRSSLLTGMHTGHAPIRGNMNWEPEGNWPLPAESFTIAELLKKQGYKTGAFGKWGLGYVDTEGDPNAQGFDEFFGYNCQSLAHNYYPDHLWRNHEKIRLIENENGKTGGYSPDLIQDAALKFIKANKSNSFFLYYPTTLPHAELSAKEKYIEKFRGKYNPEKNYSGVDTGPSYRLGPYCSQNEGHAVFAAMVTELDDYVGEILSTLKKLEIDNNTIVIFTSDNGPHLEGGADPDFFKSNGPFRGYKRDLYEGGLRVPMLIRWPDKVKAGEISNHIFAFWDVFPTFAEIADFDCPENIDGISFLPELTGKTQAIHKYLYWEFHEQGGKAAVRMGNWKAVKLNIDKIPQGELELFNLSTDLGELTNVSSFNPEIVSKMEMIIKQAHRPSKIFPFDFEE
jgi:arylsulfatase A-like enzyme